MKTNPERNFFILYHASKYFAIHITNRNKDILKRYCKIFNFSFFFKKSPAMKLRNNTAELLFLILDFFCEISH